MKLFEIQILEGKLLHIEGTCPTNSEISSYRSKGIFSIFEYSVSKDATFICIASSLRILEELGELVMKSSPKLVFRIGSMHTKLYPDILMVREAITTIVFPIVMLRKIKTEVW
jgi:hypothetical protein